MSTLTELKDRFSFVFSPEQATVLAEAIFSNYNQLAKTSDFQELKAVVNDLAVAQGELTVAQKRTEERVEELAVAQKRTEEEVKRLAKSQEEMSRAVKSLARQIGGLSEAFGSSLEDLALDLVPDLLEKYWNMEAITASRAEIEFDGGAIEFDLYIEGNIGDRKIVVLGEVKSNITKDEVTKFYKLVEKVKPTFTDVEVRVVFFGYRAYKEVKTLIDSLGGYLIFSNTRKL